MPTKKYNPFRTAFSKAAPADQLKAVKKVVKSFDTLQQCVNELYRVNPVLSVRQDGRLMFLTDKHLFV
jgi:hypothetical protein